MMLRHRVRRASRPLLIATVVAGLSVAGLSACGKSDASPSPGAPTTTDAVVARVAGEEVTQAQVDTVSAEARLAGRSDDAVAARDEAVRRALVRREAERLGIRIGDEAVARRVSGVEQNAGGAQALDVALERASMTREQLGQAVRYSLLVQAVADAKHASLKATPTQVRAFYDRHRADLYTRGASYRFGKITVPGEKLAEKLVRLLRRGASFAEVARRYSMDPQTRFRGGEVGWVLAFTVPGEVLTVVEHVAPGGVADPVRSAGKWQVYKVFARRPSRVLPFAEVAGPIRRELTRRQRAAALDDWLARARERATIEILP
jgi:peptidyl-prolyl cis-trans isomerase C